MARQDPLADRVMEQMLVGVSTRDYARSLEPLPAPFRSRGTTRSAVSRHFVARTQAQVESFLSRRLEGETYPVLMIDGKGFGEHLLITILGINRDGQKRILGIAEGSTENGALCRRLLSDLVDRGFSIEEARLVVIDGGKGLRKAANKAVDRPPRPPAAENGGGRRRVQAGLAASRGRFDALPGLEPPKPGPIRADSWG